jgi:hypothetical protein
MQETFYVANIQSRNAIFLKRNKRVSLYDVYVVCDVK